MKTEYEQMADNVAKLREENVEMEERIEKLKNQLSDFSTWWGKDNQRVAELEGLLDASIARELSLLKGDTTVRVAELEAKLAGALFSLSSSRMQSTALKDALREANSRAAATPKCADACGLGQARNNAKKERGRAINAECRADKLVSELSALKARMREVYQFCVQALADTSNQPKE